MNSLEAKRPVEPERLPVGPAGSAAALIYEREKPQVKSVRTLLEYFSALRLLMGTYAYCGTDMVDSTECPGTKVQYFPWEVALGYADDSMHKCIENNVPEHEKLRWIRLRDERTRAHMSHLINQGTPGGEALRAAWKGLAHLWDMEDKVVAAKTREEAADLGSSSAADTRTDRGAKGGKRPAMDGVRMAHADSKKRKICGGYNSKRGCEEPCPRGERHICSVIGKNGRICEDSRHNAQEHFGAKRE